MIRETVQVSSQHPDHYLTLKVVEGSTAVWWDAYSSTTIVICSLGVGISAVLGGPLLVSVIDRGSRKPMAWAFPADAGLSYIREKIPVRAFTRVERDRLAESIQFALRRHGPHANLEREAQGSG